MSSVVQYLRVYLRSAIRSERGASAIEYGLIAALIAAVIIGAVFALGTLLDETFSGVSEGIQNPGGGGDGGGGGG